MSASYLFYPWKDFHKPLFKYLASVRLCAEPITKPCRLKVKVTVEGYEFELFILCPLHISFTPERMFITIWSNVCLSEMCRTHDSTCWLMVKVTIEGHVFEPFIPVRSIPPVILEGFSLNFSQMFSSERLYAKLMFNYADSISRSQQKAAGI